MHHLPFSELVIRMGDPGWDFNNAYTGSAAIGELLLQYDKIRTVITGHTHHQGEYRTGGLTCYNVSEGQGGTLRLIEV